MAVYNKLLLSAGGGIVSTTQQAEQVKKTATILIGLGGTGIDCLRTIKTQVYSRLKPDDPDAVIPTYEHIRFLGVDTAERSKGDSEDEQDNLKADAVMALDDSECFSISHQDVKKALSNDQALQMRKELEWLRWRDIDKPNLSKAGAGGIRQVGRFMMMDKSKEFMARLEVEVNKAKKDLSSPTVNVHIFAGLSGGTGSGCFLDVCYMVRQLANSVGGITIFGYFFLPDVNLACIPQSKARIREYVPKNGYAAMQELDYCMQLQFNGGGFVQRYQGGKPVEWKEPPVDMCHLICATNSQGDTISNAYEYAMNVTTEYLMDFLTHSGKKHDLEEQLSNFQAMVSAADEKKTLGSNLAYCVIGASCASIPLREINTYLASELFEKFSCIGVNTPNKTDVEALAISSLARDAQSINEIYNSIFRELREGFDDSYSAYPDDWKFVRDYGNSQMVTHYTNQTAAKLNVAEKNSQSMMSAKNQKSLIGRVNTQLAGIIRDIEHGPIFAYRMITAAETHNLLNIIDGLLAENTSRWNQEAAQTPLRSADYENAKFDFDNRRGRTLFDSDQKRFNDYEYYLCVFEQHKLSMACYQSLNEVLVTFRKQLEDVTGAYYIKLSRVVETLINTFKDNRKTLEGERVTRLDGTFSTPLMTIEELKAPLDAEVDKINVSGMLDMFMGLLLDNEEVWIGEDENKISKLVNEFFVKTAFQGFADRTITSFLSDKYGTDKVEDLSNKIYRDCITELAKKAKPLFYRNDSIWNESQTDELAFISVPFDSSPVKAAAERLGREESKWELKESALTDRIFILSSACTLPLSAYNNCAEYERVYFEATPSAGRHYYEGKPIEGMLFNDWRNLPSLTPQSLLALDSAPETMHKLTAQAQALYEEADQYGVFNQYNQICEPDGQELRRQWDLIDAAAAKAAHISKASDLPAAAELLDQLKGVKKVGMIPTAYTMKNDGVAESAIKRVVQKDHFVSSPAYHVIVRDILAKVKEAANAADAVIDVLQTKIDKIQAETDKIRKRNQAINDYCDSLFSGVIGLEGGVVTYRQNSFGIEITLCKRGGDFPFYAIPLYQAFLSYQALLTDETKAEIKKNVDDRFNRNSPELKTAGAILKDELTDDKVRNWVQRAEEFPEKAEILEFITKLKQLFGSFCLDYHI